MAEKSKSEYTKVTSKVMDMHLKFLNQVRDVPSGAKTYNKRTPEQFRKDREELKPEMILGILAQSFAEGCRTDADIENNRVLFSAMLETLKGKKDVFQESMVMLANSMEKSLSQNPDSKNKSDIKGMISDIKAFASEKEITIPEISPTTVKSPTKAPNGQPSAIAQTSTAGRKDLKKTTTSQVKAKKGIDDDWVIVEDRVNSPKKPGFISKIKGFFKGNNKGRQTGR